MKGLHDAIVPRVHAGTLFTLPAVQTIQASIRSGCQVLDTVHREKLRMANEILDVKSAVQELVESYMTKWTEEMGEYGRSRDALLRLTQ